MGKTPLFERKERLIFNDGCPKLHIPDSVAQLVEQLTLNQRAESSSLSGVTSNARY
jgi:hypothetical protein